VRKLSEFSLKTRFKDRFINTFLQIPILWKYLINYDQDLKKISNPFYRVIKKILLKFLWFWPRLHDAIEWKEGKIGGNRDPNHFITISKSEHLLVDQVIERAVSNKDIILDLGCNSGRFLNDLHSKGYKNLHGVDISQASFDNMKNIFPELCKDVEVSCATFQQFLENSPDNSIDILFSRGATVELVHPSFPLISHICRITRRTVVFMINETGHSYPRFWEWEFNKYNFFLTKVERPIDTGGKGVSLMVFQGDKIQ